MFQRPPANAFLDPAPMDARQLLTVVTTHADQVGFFLDISPTFEARFLDRLPMGDIARPSRALITTIYLLGSRLLSHVPQFHANDYERRYKNAAIWSTENALQENHPAKIIHAIQARVLLAIYFFTDGNLAQGMSHIMTAVHLVFNAGFHKIRCHADRVENVQFEVLPRLEQGARTMIEEGERTRALWTVLDLDRQWSTALKRKPTLFDIRPVVDTPWPREMSEYERLRDEGLPADFQLRTLETINTYMTHGGPAATDFRELESKVSILWERATGVVREWCQASYVEDLMKKMDSRLTFLSNQVEVEMQPLHALCYPQNMGPMDIWLLRRIGVVYSMLCASSIRLFRGRPTFSRTDSVTLASGILEVAKEFGRRPNGVGYLSPIIGFLWIEAAEVVLEVAKASLAAGTQDGRNNRLKHLLAEAVVGMRRVADIWNVSPLKIQVSKIEEIVAHLNDLNWMYLY